MSVINKMLLELDRRNATAGSDAEQPPRQVKVVSPSPGGHEWFWRIVALLMLSALGWVGWVAYQLQPAAPLVTEQALQAAEQAKNGQISRAQAPTSAPVSAQVSEAPAAGAAAGAPTTPAAAPVNPGSSAGAATEEVPVEKPLREAPETLRLAQSIQTPFSESEPRATGNRAAETPRASAASAPASTRSTASGAKAKGTKPSVDKRDRAKPASQLAEAQFRRAAVLLNQGRVSEAEEQLVGALQADPTHAAARQAYVALLLEQQRTDAARRVLADALVANPSHPTFALALARILAEQRDYPGALEVMDRAGSVASNADFLALRGAVLQRMQKHAEAIDVYQASVRGAPQPGTTWVGYAISLEAVGRNSDAASAYRRSLGAGGLTREVREYAEARIRALE